MTAGLTYNIIEIFTNEHARWHAAPLHEAVVHLLTTEEVAARCVVSKGIAGCYEDGEVASHRVLDLSYNMPIKIEIILPAPDLERVLGRIEEMAADGVVVVRQEMMRILAPKPRHKP
jgi:PII-like signaling protein